MGQRVTRRRVEARNCRPEHAVARLLQYIATWHPPHAMRSGTVAAVLLHWHELPKACWDLRALARLATCPLKHRQPKLRKLQATPQSQLTTSCTPRIGRTT